jgi:hypothetical protein
VKRILALAIIICFWLASPANALFGSECKEPKKVVKKFDQDIQVEVSNLLKLEQRQSSYLKLVTLTPEMRKEKYKDCMTPKNGISFGHKICRSYLTFPNNEYRCIVSQSKCNQVATDIYDQKNSLDSLRDTRNQVIFNNQKCFDPVLVVEAQRYLGK